MADDQIVDADTLADWLGVTPRMVRELASRKRIPKARPGRYPLHGAVRAYCEHVREVAAGRSSEVDTLDLVAERARLARAQAVKIERENALAEGSVVLVEHVAEAFGQQCATVRNALLAIPRERAPQLHRCKTPIELETALRDAIHGALEALSSDAADRPAKGCR